MKKSKIDEDKKLSIFIIAIVLIIVISISAIVYGVHKQKSSNEDETESQSSVSASVNEDVSASDKNKSDSNSETDHAASSSSANDNNNSSDSAITSKSSGSVNVNVEAENKRYKEECSAINKKYDDIIATNEATKRLLLQEYYEKDEDLNNKQAELDILKATGAAISESDPRYQEIKSLQAQTDNLQKDIDDADNKISNAKSSKTKELAEAEKKHNANLNK